VVAAGDGHQALQGERMNCGLLLASPSSWHFVLTFGFIYNRRNGSSHSPIAAYAVIAVVAVFVLGYFATLEFPRFSGRLDLPRELCAFAASRPLLRSPPPALPTLRPAPRWNRAGYASSVRPWVWRLAPRGQPQQQRSR
jgi:hypothetical protein